MANTTWREAKKVHCLGIGGSGLSAVARMFLARGCLVSGSDLVASEITEALERQGAKITIGQNFASVPLDADLIIYSAALEVAEPAFLNEVRGLGIPSYSYAEMLGQISHDQYTIAVAGTHGKTTTTAMLAAIMLDADLSPTVIVGALLNSHGSNFVGGDSQYLLIEADEYRRSFLNLWPRLLVITNLDLDHLDYYRDLADIQSAFRELALRVPAEGAIVCDLTQANLTPVIAGVQAKIVDYSPLANPPVGGSKLILQVPGQHNLANAAAALTAAGALGISPELGRESLRQFRGTWRRFQLRGQMAGGALVYDDYAHNPPKIRAALQGAREAFPGQRIIAVFQPHLYSRTKALFADFTKAFADADEVIVADIYAARERPDPTISSADLARAISQTGKPAQYLGDFKAIEDYLRPRVTAGDLILLLGAGDIPQLGANLVVKKE